MKSLYVAALIMLCCGCKVITYTDKSGAKFKSYSLGTKTIVADIVKDGDKLQVTGYTSENQELKAIVSAAVEAAIKGAAKGVVP